MIVEILQTVATQSSSNELREYWQYITNAATIGAFLFTWRTQSRMTRIETMLSEPELGIVPAVGHLRKSSHQVRNDLNEHGVRLDGHDKEIGEIKEDRRHVQRRSEDRE